MRRAFVLGFVTLSLVAGSAAPAAVATFRPGIYYIDPSTESSGGELKLFAKDTPGITIDGQGFDASPKKVVWANPGLDQLVVATPDGALDTVELEDLFAPARPSLSPDGRQVVVQATETPVDPQLGPQNLAVYIVALSSGKWRRLTDLPSAPVPGYELPEWLPTGDRIAYWSAESGCQTIQIVDALTGDVEAAINDDGPTGCFQPNASTGPRFHFTSSRDGDEILIAGQMQIYDSHTGDLLVDLRDEVLAGLNPAGYAPDNRFPGQSNAGTFPLDATFSPDGSEIVFDGAVERLSDSTFGALLMRIDRDGTDFEVLEGPLEVNPALSNDHNFSQLTPTWLPQYQATASIKVSTARSFDTAKASSVTRPGVTKMFIIKIQNGGEAPDRFTVVGPGSFSGLTIKYLAGSRAITADVIDGTYSTGLLAPGVNRKIKLVVTADRSMKGSTSVLPVKATSGAAGTRDTVRASLRIQ